MDANTHPTMVPTNTASWIHSNTSVVKWMPMYFGSLLRPRNERLPTMLMEAASEGVWGEVSGCEMVSEREGLGFGGSCDGVGDRRSAGCRAGKGSDETAVWGCTSTCSWTPSMKPISPRLNGKGPACSLDSCDNRVEEEDAIVAVDAIMDSSGKSGGGRGNESAVKLKGERWARDY